MEEQNQRGNRQLRILIKNQRSIKLGCLYPRRAKPTGDDPSEKLSKQDDGLICYDVDTHETLNQNGDADSMDISETYLSGQNQESGVGDEVSLPSSIQKYSEASDMEWEIGNHISLYLDDDSEYSPEIEVVPDIGGEVEYPIIDDEFIIKSEKTGHCFNEFMADEISQESFDEESLNSDPFSSSSDSESTGSYDYFESLIKEKTAAPDQLDKECNQLENFNTLNPHSKVSRLNSIVAENAAKPKNEESYLKRSAAKCKKPIEDCDELGHNFNPRAPNFYPLDLDPEAEKVDLKHQELDEKKNAEEWMVDYALRQAVTKLGLARKRKVTMLVEAFEKVMPITKCELHLRHSSALNHARTIQACN
ncbi:hypothetical protein BUALT_Bualt19G0048000 [Buddleja alternifolia]|uniref:Calmodulin-binding domain-containing protein n=1 Tax=Buddleja alternifolia TaxID=168488 RepID=A0AAV6W284_9LAMI|nr:hypothetical protein BUALT_Bualt19G0048000 [Buddleja alternifolia]